MEADTGEVRHAGVIEGQLGTAEGGGGLPADRKDRAGGGHEVRVVGM